MNDDEKWRAILGFKYRILPNGDQQCENYINKQSGLI
jgi:hypothetical protein